ncbi:MAG: response regulator [Acidobacteriaceae bacterium]|nr:response regulator [Acidobacteriaceae bacterium]
MTNENRPLIFVVDDETLISRSLATILKQQGFSARDFNDPRRALEMALITPPDLLLSDVMMPYLSGIELAIAMKKITPCKVLLFSGQAGTVDLLESARNRGYDFELLHKPIHPAELLREIRHSLPLELCN